MNPRDADPLYVHEDEPTRNERRERRLDNGRKMGVSGRSVFLLQGLATRVQKRRVQHRKRGARNG